jgi:methylmalonyl-CoA mutase cobalamin-binding domain/chain
LDIRGKSEYGRPPIGMPGDTLPRTRRTASHDNAIARGRAIPDALNTMELATHPTLQTKERDPIRSVLDEYLEAVIDTDCDRAMRIVHEAVVQGVSPEDIVLRVVIPSMTLMDTSIKEGSTINLAQHFMIAQIASDVTDEMCTKFRTPPQKTGTIVLGTSRGDFHGLGKRIVGECLKANMINVIDLGLNVAPERFVEQAIANNAQVIGISSLMLHTARGEDGCLRVRQILKDAGLEKKIKIIVGGVPYRWDPGLYKVVQADAWADNAIAAGPMVKTLIEEAKQ